MTATASAIDLTGTPAVPFSRLVRVELRKSYDTRAGFWLLVSIIAIMLVVVVIALIITLVQSEPVLLGDFVAIAAYLTAFLLPILAIMLVTSEWSQRSAMVTFSLEPRRVRVIFAKMAVSVLLTLLTLAAALVIGVACTLICEIAQPDLTSWDLGLDGLAGFLVTQTLAMLGGFAIATLLLNTPASIVLFVVYRFVLPGVFAIASELIEWFADVAPWVDFQAAQDEIYEWNMSGVEAWSHLLVSGFIWLVIPVAFGLWRILRAEVK